MLGGASCTAPAAKVDSTPPASSDGVSAEGETDRPTSESSATRSTTTSNSTASTRSATTTPLPSVELDVDPAPTGFAGVLGLTGGLGREEYVVVSTADAGAGTYREALSEGGRYIRFDPSIDGSDIALVEPVVVDGSDLTIDGSDVDVTIVGHATRFSGTNVVIAGMTYRDLDGSDDEDALTFLDASEPQVIGLYGNRFAQATDGLIDLIWNRNNDVYVTACDNRFEHHDKAMLIDSGRDEREGGRYHVTLCRNLWSDIYQRTPLSRRALVHQYNSVFEDYGKPDGDGGGSKAGGDEQSQHLLENNVAIPRRLGAQTFDGSIVTEPRSEWAGPQLDGLGRVAARGSMLQTVGEISATEVEHEPELVFDPPYQYPLAPATEALATAVRTIAGTCVPVAAARVVPCAPVRLLAAGAPVRAIVVGEVERVSFDLGGVERRPTAETDDGEYVLTVELPPGEVTTLRAVATTADGRSVRSDPVIVAVIE